MCFIGYGLGSVAASFFSGSWSQIKTNMAALWPLTWHGPISSLISTHTRIPFPFLWHHHHYLTRQHIATIQSSGVVLQPICFKARWVVRCGDAPVHTNVVQQCPAHFCGPPSSFEWMLLFSCHHRTRLLLNCVFLNNGQNQILIINEAFPSPLTWSLLFWWYNH